MRHTFFSCEWIGKTVARVVTSPLVNGMRSGVGIVFTDGTTLQFDGGDGSVEYGLFWLTGHPSAPKRVPLARKVRVMGSRTRLPQG